MFPILAAAGCARPLANPQVLDRSFQSAVKRIRAEWDGVDYLVVAPGEWKNELMPLIEHRKYEGMKAAFLPVEFCAGEGGNSSAAPSFEDCRKAARALLASKKPGGKRYLLIAGDVDRVPTGFRGFTLGERRGKVNVASDVLYAVAEGLDRHEFSVGRLPADSAAELGTMVKKILDYEKKSDFKPWRRKVGFIAAPFGGGMLVDAAIESAATNVIANIIPQRFTLSMTYGKSGSIYFWPAEKFEDKAVDVFNEGCLAWVYMGHGSRTQFSCVRRVQSSRFRRVYRNYPIFNMNTVKKLAPRSGLPIMVHLCCLTGRFDYEKDDCLAEELLKFPAGPAFVLASSRKSDPYGNVVMGRETVMTLFSAKGGRLGDILLDAKARMLAPADAFRSTLDAAARLFTEMPLEASLQSHVLMYNIFGDPAMKLALPGVGVEIEAAVKDRRIAVRAELQKMKKGRFIATLEIPRTSLMGKPVEYEKDREDEQYMANHKMANDKVMVKLEREFGGSDLKFELAPKEKLKPGTYYVKIYAWNESASAAGAAEIKIPDDGK